MEAMLVRQVLKRCGILQCNNPTELILESIDWYNGYHNQESNDNTIRP